MMFNFLMFLDQHFGDGDRWEDRDATPLDWPIALLLGLLAVAGGVYVVVRLWQSTLY